MTEPDVDVLIVGAGVSGIGMAAHLHTKQPSKTYALIDARDQIGGTWDLFRYPGVRSDSDLHTYAYDFKPWTDIKAFADGPSIMNYLQQAVEEHSITPQIRFGYDVRSAHWSSDDARWTIRAERRSDGEPVDTTARWLFWGGGYFRYDRGYTPEIPGLEDFGGRLVHPQQWPEDIDFAGKRIVVIGSGATAVTLVPALSKTAAHVTMLQRTPTYMLALPGTDPVYQLSSRLFGPARAHRLTRWKNLLLDDVSYRAMRRFPGRSSKILRSWVAKELPEGYDIETHFSPPYNPWDQRLCVVLDSDLFQAISEGRASVATDRIRRVTQAGMELDSGRSLEADIIVTATGLDLVPMGGIEYTVDGRQIDIGDTIAYKSMMLAGLPNFVYSFGYINASWTLKVNLVAQHLCRLLALMDEREYDYAIPDAPDPREPTAPMFEMTSGYIRRAVDHFPKQGSSEPWKIRMDYGYDRKLLLEGPVGDHMRFFRASEQAKASPVAEGSVARAA
jgi:monooxygenase